MNHVQIILLSVTLIVLILIFFGLAFTFYPKHKRIRSMHLSDIANHIAAKRPIRPVLDFFAGDNRNFLHRIATGILNRAESDLTVQAFYFVKFVAVILAFIMVFFIRYTNMGYTRQAIIAQPAGNVNLFTGATASDYSKNVERYEAMVKKIGEQELQKLDDNEILKKAREVLTDILKTSDHDTLEEQANAFLSTYRKVKSIPLFDYWSILVIILSFWLPELLLLIKRLLLTGMYRKEVIKLENIFELLGSVQGIKTFDILNEMAKASSIYRKHLLHCMERFKTDKAEALDSMKDVVRNKRFSRLVDVIRVFSLTDRKLAMQILERNRIEQEEDLLITAEEDVDVVDLIAFISIMPVVWLLINLLLKPMLDTIFEVFKYV